MGRQQTGMHTMHLQVSGKQIDIGGALRDHVERRLSNGVAKYFDRAIDAHVVFSREAHQFRADCTVHIGHGIKATAEAAAEDAYGAFDAAAERLEKQLRRHKRRIRNHHHGADGQEQA
jgi:ribosomal subunit interface protein